jgi:hypothetical protein
MSLVNRTNDELPLDALKVRETGESCRQQARLMVHREKAQS